MTQTATHSASGLPEGTPQGDAPLSFSALYAYQDLQVPVTVVARRCPETGILMRSTRDHCFAREGRTKINALLGRRLCQRVEGARLLNADGTPFQWSAH